jgi:hypothetical protein
VGPGLQTRALRHLLAGAVGLGAWGYHVFDGLSWLDATLNAAMVAVLLAPALHHFLRRFHLELLEHDGTDS